MSSFLPKIGQWYQDRDSGLLYSKSLPSTPMKHVLQLQYLDGEISRLRSG
jgi:hypothetical protein